MVQRKMRGTKLAFIILIIVFIIAAIFTISPSSYNWVLEKTNPNSVVVKTENGLNKNNVSIVWCTEKPRCDTIYKKGALTNKHFKEKGRNSFLVFYEDSLITIFSQEKKETWEGFSYNITLKKEFSRIIAEVKISE